MSKISTILTALLASLLVNGCSTPSSSTTLVYISDGFVQCEQPPMTLTTTQSILTNAGIDVISSYCAQITDLAIISMCGAGGTGIHLHEIASQDSNKATEAGFDNVSKLAEQALNYEMIDCEL
ncbi:hypothetical protein K6Y31_05095 [Motilimonas cestriensis]|uniref:Lipoprotein n=1 Tax=Motilimonas cestriensis TaxID=2742685 RepID=A0ABS8W5D3_9GAMM|nr:hypothetical protein [Motilimonas cestriensis]MCE2594187.1 hypothetical protein [Motilimonas cestriensis]